MPYLRIVKQTGDSVSDQYCNEDTTLIDGGDRETIRAARPLRRTETGLQQRRAPSQLHDCVPCAWTSAVCVHASSYGADRVDDCAHSTVCGCYASGGDDDEIWYDPCVDASFGCDYGSRFHRWSCSPYCLCLGYAATADVSNADLYRHWNDVVGIVWEKG